MTRNIRVEVDDAVFEEYSRRKDQLGLSWEEVLRRGLQDKTVIESLQESQTPLEALGANDPLGRQVIDQFAPSKPEDNDSLDARVEKLEQTESAELEFEFLERPHHRIPLQVIIQTSTTGHEIEVVSVHQTDTGTNRFDKEDRDKILQEMADDNVVLHLNDGRETYYVEPTLTWQNDDVGNLVVSNISIGKVHPHEGKS
jgi:hypothetical protein